MTSVGMGERDRASTWATWHVLSPIASFQAEFPYERFCSQQDICVLPLRLHAAVQRTVNLSTLRLSPLRYLFGVLENIQHGCECQIT